MVTVDGTQGVVAAFGSAMNIHLLRKSLALVVASVLMVLQTEWPTRRWSRWCPSTWSMLNTVICPHEENVLLFFLAVPILFHLGHFRPEDDPGSPFARWHVVRAVA